MAKIITDRNARLTNLNDKHAMLRVTFREKSAKLIEDFVILINGLVVQCYDEKLVNQSPKYQAFVDSVIGQDIAHYIATTINHEAHLGGDKDIKQVYIGTYDDNTVFVGKQVWTNSPLMYFTVIDEEELMM